MGSWPQVVPRLLHSQGVLAHRPRSQCHKAAFACSSNSRSTSHARRQVVTEERALSERYPEYAEYKAKVKKVRGPGGL
mgnify:CR=1 FL=1